MSRVLRLVVLVVATSLWIAAPAQAATVNTIIKSGPTGTITSTTATFTFKAKPKKGATFQCRMDGGKFKKCTSPATYKGLAQGAHTFAVRAKKDGRKDKTPATRTFTVDTVAPTPTITGGPTGTTDDTTPTFTFSAAGAKGFTCQIDAAVPVACTGTFTPAASLVDGNHAFTVRARDAVGNTASATRAFAVLTPLTKDLATAEAAGAFLLPDSAAIDVAAACGGDVRVDCPDGVTPVPPDEQVQLVSSRTVTEVVGQDRYDLVALVDVTTLVPVKVTSQGLTCDLTMTSASGVSPQWRVAASLDFVHPTGSSEWRIHVSNPDLTQVEDADILLSGSFACEIASSFVGAAKDSVVSQLEGQLTPVLCADPGPAYVGLCPAP